MALELVVGALLGTAVSELLSAVKDARTKISSFEPILKRLESTLVAITSRLHEITLLDQKLHLSTHQSGMDDLAVLVRDGKELVLKCSKVYRLNYVKKVQYSKLLQDLDANLLRYFVTVLPLDQFKDGKEILVVVKELQRSMFYLVNQDETLGKIEDEIRSIKLGEIKNDSCADSKGEILKNVQESKERVGEIMVEMKNGAEGSSSLKSDETLREIEDEIRSINPGEIENDSCTDSKGEILKIYVQESKEKVGEIMVEMKDGAEGSNSLKSDETLGEIEDEMRSINPGEIKFDSSTDSKGENVNLYVQKPKKKLGETMVERKDEAEGSSFIERDYQETPNLCYLHRDGFSASNNRDVSNSRNNQQQFTYSDVVTITANFQRELGKGAFGKMYHGYLDGNQVAIKIVNTASHQGCSHHFRAEAEIFMRVKHRNLTTLVGYCDEGNKKGLIYEYMAKSDLRSHLSDRYAKVLSWEMRLNIMVDAAQGLEYLHKGCKPPIIHRNIKSSNILLNDDFEAKLADFGLSMFSPQDDEETAFRIIGYMGPECIHENFRSNEKSDVFSYGVVLLEIITARPPLERRRGFLYHWVAEMLRGTRDVRSVVDSRLNNEFEINSMWKAVDLAMECVSISNTRPSMSQVVIELNRCWDMEKARLNKSYRGKFI